MIALSGGSTAERERIAEGLIGCGKVRLAAYSMYPPAPTAVGDGKRPRLVINGVERGRQLAMTLDSLEDDLPMGDGLVLPHCLGAEEAQLVREQGGEVWHVYGARLSELVPIRREDRMITAGSPSPRHVLEPLEALSEYMLAMGLADRVQPRA